MPRIPWRRLAAGERRWAVLGIAIIVALWEAGHRAYGDFVLPSPLATLAALGRLAADGALGPAILTTARDACSGFLAATLAGSLLGGIAGRSRPVRAMLQPLATMLIGVPAIAWVVLSLLWFGGSGLAATFSVAVAAGPVVFSAATQGTRTVDGGLRTMARAFRVPAGAMIVDVYLPHVLSYLLPALGTALAMSWKVAVMAELLSGTGGIGDGLATARAEVDTAKTMAWVVVVVALLLVVERFVIEPVRRYFETWRRGLPGEAA
ncbi:MAG: binding-protein-dependent transport system inner rane component [Proteobacteria bacterium]|nr:binding-protein-dependent transport system inner rane component [Pseudomonadota bacterium]